MLIALGTLLAVAGCGQRTAPAGESAAAAGPDPPGLAPGERRAVINGVDHWYRVAGATTSPVPPVVFLHGGPGQGSVHFAVLAGPALERDLRMVYVDQRGSGRSATPEDGAYSIPLLVDDLEGLRRTLGVSRIVLLGQSFGGTLALEYAARFPDRVAAIVFVAGLWDAVVQCRLRLRTLAERRPEVYRRIRGDSLADDGTRRNDCEREMAALASADAWDAYTTEAMYPDPEVRRRMEAVEEEHGYRNTGALGAGLVRAGLPDYRFTRHDRLTMPVLVIAGRHDGAARPEGLRELADRLPDATFLEYGGSGHFPYLDETRRFARDVVGFLRTEALREGQR